MMRVFSDEGAKCWYVKYYIHKSQTGQDLFVLLDAQFVPIRMLQVVARIVRVHDLCPHMYSRSNKNTFLIIW